MLVVDLDKAVQDDNEKMDEVEKTSESSQPSTPKQDVSKKYVPKKDIPKKDVSNHGEVATMEQIDDGANSLTETMKRETETRQRKVRFLISRY